MRKTLMIHPNKSAQKIAARALDIRKKLPKYKRGGLDPLEAHELGIGSGVKRAIDIASGKKIDAYRVQRFFTRHRSNFINAKLKNLKLEDSKALQAWDLWGGEPLRKQVDIEIKKHEKSIENNPREKLDAASNKIPYSKLAELLPRKYIIRLSKDNNQFDVLFTGYERRRLHGRTIDDNQKIYFQKRHIISFKRLP